MIVASHPELHTATRSLYQHLWLERAAREARPEWAERPPLSTIGVSLDRDVWDEVAATSAGPLLVSDGPLGLPGDHFGDDAYDVSTLRRGGGSLVVWVWHHHDVEWSRVEVSFPYWRGDYYVGCQVVGLENSEPPRLGRHLHLVDSAETGYDGHGHVAADQVTDDDVAFFAALVRGASTATGKAADDRRLPTLHEAVGMFGAYFTGLHATALRALRSLRVGPHPGVANGGGATAPVLRAKRSLEGDVWDSVATETTLGRLMMLRGPVQLPGSVPAGADDDVSTLRRTSTSLIVSLEGPHLQWSRVELSFPLWHEHVYVGCQLVGLENSAMPRLVRRLELIDYRNTPGYAGHMRLDTSRIEEFDLWVLEGLLRWAAGDVTEVA